MKLTSALVAATAAIASTQAFDIKPLILGGTEVPAGQKTYTVGLLDSLRGGTVCGGSLIAPTIVLTAAHCAGHAKYVSIGSHFSNGSADDERIAVRKEFKHPKNNPDTNSYDLSIIVLASPSTFAPVKLLTDDPKTFVGTTVTTMGWGRTSQDGSPSNPLLRVDVSVLSNTDCQRDLSGYTVDSTMFCAGGAKNKDTCQGDSGGPVVLERATGDVLVGVVSWGLGCGAVKKPGVYASVSAAKSWIEPYVSSRSFVWD